MAAVGRVAARNPPSPGLIAKQILVHRGDQEPFWQTFWVRPDAVWRRGTTFEGAMKELGADHEESDVALKDWKQDPSTIGGLRFRGAAYRAFGLEALMEKDAERVADYYGIMPQAALITMKQGYEDEALVNAVSAQATVSQAQWMADHGAESEVTLYRGVKADAKPSGDYAADGITSFATNPAVARRFAEDGGSVIQVRVPVASIVVSGQANPLLGGAFAGVFETEVIVASDGSLPGRVVARTSKPKRRRKAG